MHSATVKKNGSLRLLASYFRLFQCHLQAPCGMALWEAAQMAHPLTLRLLMSHIYIYIYIYIYMEHPFLMFLDHTQRRSTVGRTPLDE